MLDLMTLSLKNETLELLIVRVAEVQLAIRSSSIKRLENFRLKALNKVDKIGHPALLGYISPNFTAVFDLARLLKLETPGSANEPDETGKKESQLLQIEYKGYLAGFVVDQAQEVVRVNLAELDVLPSVVEKARLRPAAWALWRKDEQEILILIEPTEAISAEEWEQLNRQET